MKATKSSIIEMRLNMSANYGYYLPLSSSVFESVRYLAIAPKTEGFGHDEKQKIDKDGTPVWTVSALVKFQGSKQETELFTLAASPELAGKINAIEELTPIRLVGLAGGKWSKSQTDKTSWSFQISGIEVIKG